MVLPAPGGGIVAVSIVPLRRALASLLVLVPFAACASAQVGGPYRVTDLGALPGFDHASVALRISDHGEIFGISQGPMDPELERVIRAHPKMFGLAPGDPVAGGPDSRRFFVYLPEPNYDLPAGLNDLGAMGPMWGEGYAVNANGEWVGKNVFSHDGVFIEAFIWDAVTHGEILGTFPGGTSSAATDISHTSIVCGWSETGERDAHGFPRLQPFRWSPAEGLQALAPLPGWAHCTAEGVNDSGLIVGRASNSSGQLDRYPQSTLGDFSGGRGVIWYAGQAVDLNDLLAAGSGWTIETAFDINNRGHIVGSGVSPTGERRAVLLEPVLNDFNDDDEVDQLDLYAFLADHEDGEPTADVNRDGQVDAQDAAIFVGGLTPAKPDPVALDFSEHCWFLMISSVFETGLPPAARAAGSCAELSRGPWLRQRERWDAYHPEFNAACYGCDGNAPGNPSPNGKPGWPGQSFMNPYAPHGGPGGDGADGGDGGHGGNGADASADSPPGNGGDGGDAGVGGNGGDGGDGGDNRVGGDAGRGGNGGRGGHGGDARHGGNGGQGGDGGPGGNGAATGASYAGDGGDGGNGGDARPGGNGGQGGDGGPGGNGAATGASYAGDGGDGGDGGNASGSGNGGPGGQGGDGGDAPSLQGAFAGDGGDGGGGGNARGGRGGNGGDGGDGGDSRNLDGGDGGNGGRGGYARTGDGGDGGRGGDGGSSEGRYQGRGGDGGDGGGSSTANGGNGGHGGNGGAAPPGANPARPGADGGDGGDGGRARTGRGGDGGDGGAGGPGSDVGRAGRPGNGGAGTGRPGNGR